MDKEIANRVTSEVAMFLGRDQLIEALTKATMRVVELQGELAAARDAALEECAREIETCGDRHIRRGYERYDFSVVVRAMKATP